MFEGELKVGKKTAERIFRENRDKCSIVLNTAEVPYTQWKTMVENNVNFGILYTAMVSHEVEDNGVSVRIVSHDKGIIILNNRVFTEIYRNIEMTSKKWEDETVVYTGFTTLGVDKLEDGRLRVTCTGDMTKEEIDAVNKEDYIKFEEVYWESDGAYEVERVFEG